MRELLILTSLAFTLLFVGCENNQKEDKTKDDEMEGRIEFTPDDLSPCIKKELKLNTKYDVATYKSLNTQYFNEVMDYPTKKSRDMDDQLMDLLASRDKLVDKSNNEINYKDSLNYQEAIKLDHYIDSLKQQLRTYRKEVSGYVFIHTFKSLEDTISIIFLMDKYCIYSEAIEIRTIPTSLNPDNYKIYIRE